MPIRRRSSSCSLPACAYPCSCSRTELQRAQPPAAAMTKSCTIPAGAATACGRRTHDRAALPGSGRHRSQFDDHLQGRAAIDLSTDCGDFVIRRRDGLFAYQLAVVVDDAAQRITHVVRGADLLAALPGRSPCRQRWACRLRCTHICRWSPTQWDQTVQVDRRRSDRRTTRPSRELWRALEFLKQAPPADLRRRRLQQRCGNGQSNTGTCSRCTDCARLHRRSP